MVKGITFAGVKCLDCRHCASDYLMLLNGTYRIAVCQNNIVDQVVVDAEVERECEHWWQKQKQEEE